MKLGDFAKLAETFGVMVTVKDITPKEVSYINKAVNVSAYSEILGSALVRTMAKAEYNTNNIGHFGLASESYTHFTSPIRRYPDLMVHRLICNTLFGTDYQIEASLDEACKQSTENEQRAEQAERDIHKFKKNQISCKTYGRAFRSYHNVCGSFRFKYICRIHYAERYYTSGINPRRYIPVQQKSSNGQRAYHGKIIQSI